MKLIKGVGNNFFALDIGTNAVRVVQLENKLEVVEFFQMKLKERTDWDTALRQVDPQRLYPDGADPRQSFRDAAQGLDRRRRLPRHARDDVDPRLLPRRVG